MGSMNYFSQVVQEIFQNNYLKTNFEKLRNQRFCLTFWNSMREIFLKKCSVFQTLNAHILRTVNATELNDEAILKSSY